MTLFLRLIGGFLARYIQPIIAGLTAFWAGRTTAKNQQLKQEQKTRERMDNAPHHTNASDADKWLRDRAKRRGIVQRDD